MSVWTEFQPLRSVILGNVFPTDELLGQLKLRGKWADAFKNINDQSLRELEVIAEVLSDRGVEVLRPNQYPLLHVTGPSGPALSPRDWFIVYGDRAMQGNDAFANHNVRTTSTIGLHALKTDIMPTHDIWFSGGFNELESIDLARPYYHTANLLRCGHDIFYSLHPCRTGNQRGLAWMKARITEINPKVRFHAVDAEEHLDGYIMFIKPGLLLSTKSKDRLPDFFKKWEVITVDETDKDKVYKKTLAHRWKKLNPIVANEYSWFMQANPEETWFSINGLSIDENTVIFPGMHSSLFKKLEKLGIECISVSMKAISFWDSGLHCCTAEISRHGGLEDYQ